MDVLQSWLFLAFTTPIIWAIIGLVDSCVVGQKIYRSAWDGPMVSGLFSIAPLLIWVLIVPTTTQPPALIDSTTLPIASFFEFQSVTAYAASSLAAVLYFLHVYFYFRALFNLNDVANAEAIMALSVVIVPIFAWFVLGERLSGAFYAAICLAFIGLVVTAWPTLQSIAKNANTARKYSKRIDMSVSLFLAILCISLSMVLQAKAVETINFSAVTICFSATTFGISVVALVLFKKYRQSLFVILQRYYPIFLCAEAFEVIARLSGLRAIEIGPSVTAVALVHSTLPIIIIGISLMIVGADRIQNFLSPVLRETFALQSQSIQTKSTLLVISVAAAIILQQNNAL